LLAGLDAAEASDLEGVLVTPVDVPAVSAATIRTLLAAARGSRAAIVRPVYGAVHGHPVIFKRGVFDELRRADAGEGARSVVRRDPSRVVDVPVDDAGVVYDVDTPADYERLFGESIAPGTGPK
jgi:molybdenum cofactor cytidylyltransferase